MSEHIRMKKQTRKSVALKHNMKNLMKTLLPMVKNIKSNEISQIKSNTMEKIRPNKRQNTPERVSNRRTKSLENNFRVNTTKNIISKTQNSC